MEERADGRKVVVDGETFIVRASSKERGGGFDFDWVSGPNRGYGFSEGGGRQLGIDDVDELELARSIRQFLAMVDPATGFIES